MALASPHWPNGSPRASTGRSCGKIPKILFSPTSTPTVPGRRSRRSYSICSITICDYIFEKDRIYAYLNLDDNELFIYQRLYDLLAQDVPAPDLVIYLQAPTEVLIKRLRGREHDPERPFPVPDEEYVRELNEAYHHFFFHYSATSLLVIESSQFRPQDDDEALDALVKQIKTMGRGTRYYVPRTG